MTKDKALDLALEALSTAHLVVEDDMLADEIANAITAIKQARSAPVQEPVADGLIRQYITALVANKPDEAANATKGMVDYVYTTPPAAAVPLTDEQIEMIWTVDQTSADDCASLYYAKVIARAIEAAHGITKGGAA